MILNHPTLSESEVKLLVTAADNVYQDQVSLNGWEVITPDLTSPNYGLDPELITGNIFKVEGDLLNVPFGVNLPFGDANAAVLKSGDNLLLAFRGTEIPEGDESYWLRLEEHYDLFEPLFTALDNYIQANPTSRILVTGHSLGAAMAEFYMAEHPGSLYSAVTVASPTASNDPTDTRILNIGFENDPVYEITSGDPFGIGNGGADPNNSTTDLFLDLDSLGLFAGLNTHASSNYIYATERLFDSAYYDQIERDSFVIVDRKNSNVNVSDVFLSTDKDVFILGEDNKADDIKGDQKDDILEGLGGNDTLKGDLISASYYSGNDTLDGGEGNDQLDGSKGDEDTAVFSGNFEDYDYSKSEDGKTITFDHVRGLAAGNPSDGIDTLQNIEWGQFTNETVPIGNLRTLTAQTTSTPRIIPLPLEDGVLETETKQATDTTASPNVNDPLTPPYVSLTMPVEMLDGNVDYTLNISPYKPDTQYNIVYIFDTSLSMSASELQAAKDAYINVTNYFINQGLADDINFGLVSFGNQAVLQTDSNGDRNLTADEAIAAIQGLTTATVIGTNYDAGLWQGVNFLTTSPLRPSFPTNPGGTTSISYFFSDGQNSSDRFTMLNTAKTLRRYSNVQAFGINNLSPIVANDINFIDSNNGVMMNSIADLSTELQKSGLAGKVDHVNILVDDVVVDTIEPAQLTDSPLGLTYEGSVENLDVSVDAENTITAEVVFNDTTATTSVDYTVTAGDGELKDVNGNPIAESGDGDNPDPLERIRDGSDTDDDITLGYADRGANGGAGGDYIIGNKRDNILDGGDGNDTIKGHEGYDTIITGAGTNKVDGGEGIDTVLYGDVIYQGSNISLRQAADTVNYNNTDTLTDIEFIQFSDVRISAETLQVVPILEAAEISVPEGDSGNTTAPITLNLSTPAPVDVTFDYSTADIDAVAGSDYVATSGQITIPAGQTSATVNVTIKGDIIYEPNEEFGLNLSAISGATFKDNVTEYAAVAQIANDDPVNYPPFSLGIPNTITTTNAPNQSINLAEAFQDLEDTTLTYAVQNNTNSALFDAVTIDQANKILLLDYQANTTGTSELTIRATDSQGFFVDTSFTVSAISATSNNDTIVGGDGNDYLDGNLGNDNISGLGGDDTLTGGAGVDTLIGNAGDDTYIVDTATDTITENQGEGIDRVSSRVSYTLGSNIENINLTGTNATNGTGNTIDNSIAGNSANNRLSGGTGDDTLSGAAGIDTLIGGTGNDTYLVDITTDTLTENADQGTDKVDSNVTYTLGGNIENLTLTGTSAINGTGNTLNNNITGNTANNTLSGSTGNDSLNGDAGIDTLIGGTGNDTYIVDTTTDTITENVNEGTDTVSSSVTYTLGANLENLTLTGTSAIDATGNSLNNSITGNTANNNLSGGNGNDTLNGDAGIDTLFGGSGNDTYIVDTATDILTENVDRGTDRVNSSVTYSLVNNLENLILTGTSAIDATGNALNNSLTGNTANNTLNGDAGIDTLIGGTGNDTYIVDTTTDILTENANEGTDRVDSNVTHTLVSNIENLTLTGTSAINGTGNTLNNILTGNTANNILSGDAGIDTLIGGTGDDIYIIDITTDIVTENANEGTDRVDSNVTHALISNIENLTLTGTNAINGTGNTLNNSITGNAANNTLNGVTGNDTIGGDTGDDLLIGGGGNDSLTGGAGSDRFIYNTNAAFATSAVGRDVLADFSSGTDKIVLDKTTFTSLTSIAGNGFNIASEFAVVGSDAAVATTSALIVYSSGTGNLFYNQNGVTTGLGSGAQFATLSEIPALNADDFILQA
jgi:Ca2+-binding RTX toxin-like protein